MKKVIFCILFLMFISIRMPYAEELETFEEVYCDNTTGPGHYSSFSDALMHVEEDGTVYVGKEIKIYNPIQISKSVKIKSLNREIYPVRIQQNMNQVFYLENISWFTLENIYILGWSVDVIEGKADQITIQDSKFENCNPIYVSGNSGYNIKMEGNSLIKAKVEIKPTVGENIAHLLDNQFTVPSGSQESIIFMNTNLEVSGNTFDRYSLILENGAEIEGNIHHNIFSGSVGKILIKNQGENVHFYMNKILKDFNGAITYVGNETADFTKNWWGSKDGPVQDIIIGNIDYSCWALFEDFRRFEGDDYTLADLEEACLQLGQEINEDSWLYNLRNDSVIDILDLVGITRNIE